MSRIGKQPINIPTGVSVVVQGQKVDVKGPKGSLSFTFGAGVSIKSEASRVLVTCTGSERQDNALFGTTRAVINNMVKGVVTPFKESLELNGVGYVAKIAGQVLVLSIGFSHEVKIEIPKEVKAVVNKNVIELESVDRALVGLLAAKIRKVRPPEPYLGKGIKYIEEVIRRKAGKTAKK